MPVQTDDPLIRDAFAANVPEIYINGFANFISGGDMMTVLQRNGRPVAVLNMALPIAKGYAELLLELVSGHEEEVGYTLNPYVDVEHNEADGLDA